MTPLEELCKLYRDLHRIQDRELQQASEHSVVVSQVLSEALDLCHAAIVRQVPDDRDGPTPQQYQLWWAEYVL